MLKAKDLVREVAHFIPYTGTAMGGPVVGMAAYVGLLVNAGFSVRVFSVARKPDGESIRLDARVEQVRETGVSWGGFRHGPALWRQAQTAPIDLVHSHGLWTDVNRLSADIARRRGLPHLLAPCGMLAPGALRRHWWKKVPARLWFQDRALREATCLHAKSNKEYEDIRRFGLRNPVAIIANPIALPSQKHSTSEAEFRRTLQIPETGKMLLFLGRLHPVKGLARLLQAWSVLHGTEHWSPPRLAGSPRECAGSETGSSIRDWRLVLAGPDEGGHRRELEALLVQLGCQKSVVFAGELDEAQKWGALKASDLFVMPSNFENFGNAIVEAMSCAVPVITTTGTPWKELRDAGAGWWVEPTAEKLTGALRAALAMPDEQRRAMGARAFQIAERFRPGRVAEDLIQVYQWLLSGGARPSCVKIDR